MRGAHFSIRRDCLHLTLESPFPKELSHSWNSRMPPSTAPQGQGPGQGSGHSLQVTKITPAACGCVFPESLSQASQSSFWLSIGSSSPACQSDTSHTQVPKTVFISLGGGTITQGRVSSTPSGWSCSNSQAVCTFHPLSPISVP